ncbi:MAG TPA: hypothetical protein DHU96_13795 [Actinobacteria bacterium]|nr:hypothetical protein [Actinomycetota bacterium]
MTPTVQVRPPWPAGLTGSLDRLRLDAKTGQLAYLELRHHRLTRCDYWIRVTQDTGLRNLPLHTLLPNRLGIRLMTGSLLTPDHHIDSEHNRHSQE